MTIFNNKNLKKLLITLLSLVIILGSLPTTALASEPVIDDSLLFFIETLNYVKSNYPFEIENKDLIENSIKGMLQGLDSNSNYYTKEEAEKILKNLNGQYAGIGIIIEEKNGEIIVNSVMKNSPAEKSGLKPGDSIISIDNNKVKDLSLEEVSNLIQGLPNTKVKLNILRNEKQSLNIDIIRANIKVNPIEYKILENNIGYIKIKEFNPYATTNLKNALEELDKKNVKKIILDLRDNPGGMLNQAINIAEIFVPAGPIVHIKGNKGTTTHISTNKNPKYQLAVLINENSASASEILAGAIKERGVGTLIGTRTYGKGTVQEVISLVDGSILKLTIAEYLLPNKTSIHNKGIKPDIEIENQGDRDLQLEKAIKILHKQH